MTALQAVSIALGAGVVKFAAGKIGPVITSKISSIISVKKDLSELRDIHQWISSCLERGIGGDPSLSLPTKLRNIADDIDDLLNEVQRADGDCFPKKPKSFKSRIKIAHRIKAIKKTLAAILKQKCDIDIIMKNPLALPVAVQGMIADELHLLSNVEQQQIQGTEQGEDDKKCTLSDSVEGIDGFIFIEEGIDGWSMVTRKADKEASGEEEGIVHTSVSSDDLESETEPYTTKASKLPGMQDFGQSSKTNDEQNDKQLWKIEADVQYQKNPSVDIMELINVEKPEKTGKEDDVLMTESKELNHDKTDSVMNKSDSPEVIFPD